MSFVGDILVFAPLSVQGMPKEAAVLAITMAVILVFACILESPEQVILAIAGTAGAFL